MSNVRVEPTPNPLARKFSFGTTLTSEPRDGGSDPAFASIIGAGASSVFVGEDYLTVFVRDPAEWETVERCVIEAISANMNGFARPPLEKDEAPATPSDPVISKILDILDRNIRPAVAHDGGDVRFVSFDDGVLVLEMKGACSGCPSSSATLKSGILNMMRYFVPQVRDVVAADQ